MTLRLILRLGFAGAAGSAIMSRLAGTVADLGELGLIALFRRGFSTADANVVVDNGDDAAAFVTAPGLASVVTTDQLVEGTHFRFDWVSPASVGRKLVAVNLSDLAAMGATPRYALLDVCCSPDTSVERMTGIADGLAERLRLANTHLIGGNVTRTSGPIVLGMTLIGEARPTHLLRRTGSRIGDFIYVTGVLGAARTDLLRLQAGLPMLHGAYAEPTPRLEEGVLLAQSGLVHAMCDVSDGLGRDLRRLVPGARIDLDRLPLAEGTAPADALIGGEDYELLFTSDAPLEAFASLPTRVSCIGTVTASGFEVDGASLPEGFLHF